MSAVLYTAILGGSDSLKPAPVLDGVRCVCFTDDVWQDPVGWELVKWNPTDKPRREAWRLRCLMPLAFGDVARTIWIDASFTVTDLPRLLKDSEGHAISALAHNRRWDCYEEGEKLIEIGQATAAAVGPQLTKYRQEGFRPSALSIACILVRQNTPEVNAFGEKWLSEFTRFRGDNTQLSLDYAAWVSGLSIHHLTGNRKRNPYALHDFADHDRRRKPYR